MGDDSEWMKLPTDEKCQHKVWKARVAGYEEAGKLFQTITDEKHPDFTKYVGLLKKFVTDNNAVAQDKGLDAVLAFVENAAVAGRIGSEIVSSVIAKCLNSMKTKTKEKGIEIIMLYIEIEKQDIVQECLLQGVENKQPKIVAGCVQTMTMALRDFGNKVMPIKPYMKVIPKLLEDRDKNVREETKQLIIEIYRWIGPMLKPMMSNFKPVQITELEAEFEKLPSGKAQQQRFLRSQQDLKAKMEEQAASAEGGADGDDDDGGEEESMDPYEMMPAVDILALMPKDYYEKVEAKKWQERKEVLDAVLKLSENMKLESGDYGQLMRSLLKVVGKDTNVMLVTVSAKSAAGIAKGLRKKYAPYATNSIQVVLEKFKEKKVTVVTALRELIDAAFYSATFDNVLEDLQAALENKNPSIKAETAYFLARSFAKCSLSTLPKKLLKVFCSCLLKTINDTSPEVRERSFEALGTAMKVVSEKHISPFLVDVDPLKMQKIQECCNAAVLLTPLGEPRSGGGATAAVKKAEPKPVQRPSTAPAKSDTKPTNTASRPASAKPTSKSAGGAKKKAAAGKDKKKSSEGSEFTENPLSDEAIEEKAGALFSPDTCTQLASNNWKERLAAMEKILQTLKMTEKTDIPCQVVIRTVCKKPGLKDTNFQVLKLRIELVSYLAQNSKFSKYSAECCLPDLVDKVGDVKNGVFVQEAFSCIAEAVTLEHVSKEVLRLAFEQKNPKNQSESLQWLSKAIKEFGFKINVKLLLAFIKKGLAATNPAVRTGSIQLIGTMHMYMGPKSRMFFEDEKPALLQQIDAEIEKVKDEKPPPATRGKQATEDIEEEDDEEAEGGADAVVEDLVPRNDIGDKFTEDLITKLSDKGWKIRKEGLDTITTILTEAKFITGNLGPLPEALKLRLADVNKVLMMSAIGICTILAKNMGPHAKNHFRIFGPALIGCLGDSKPNLRAAAVESLNTWLEQPGCTMLPLVEAEVLQDSLKLENPNLRMELLGWLIEKLPNHKQLPVEFRQCVPHLLACLEDRNGDVRKRAQEALVPFMIHVGYECVFKATGKLKPASKDQILAIIEKAKANLPAKPQKTKKAAAVSPVKASSPEAEPSGKQSRPLSTASSDGGAGGDKPESKQPTKSVKGKAKATSAPSKKKKQEEDFGPPMNMTVSKEQRFKDEKNMKVLKWNFIEVRSEYIEQLRTQMEKNFSKDTIQQLFHTDFKFHTKCIETLIKCLDTQHDETMCNLDLILKWFTLRFYDTNPSMLNKALEYLIGLFTMLGNEDYHLHEYEATSFIPYLILKVGENKDNVRREVRNIFKLLYKVYPASKVFSYLIDGLKSKNTKQRSECLEELGSLIEGYGITICQPSPGQALKLIAGQIGNRDNGVRNAALNSTVIAYSILGENLYKYIGTLVDKDQSLLDERIKRSMKNKTAAPPKQEERPRTAPQQQRAATQSIIQRPSSAMPKSASSNSVKKMFTMAIDDDQSSQTSQTEYQLVQIDLDEFAHPIKLPSTGLPRPPSPSMRKITPTDAATIISMVISQITSSDITTSIQALTQLDEVLKDEDRSEMIGNHVDQLLLSVSMQLKMVYSTHMGSDFISKKDAIRLYKCLLGALLAIFQNSSLAPKASKDILKDLINNLVTVLLDNRLGDLDEGPQVMRTVNVMVIRIVEKADHTAVISALIRLLQDCVSSATCSVQFLELIMKCLWRLVRMLPDFINDVNLDRILLDCHLFLKAFPSSSWKTRPSDTPLRTIKTILHSLVKLRGHKIISHISMIEDPPATSEVVQYLNKSLKDTPRENGGSMEEDTRALRGSAQKPKKINDVTHDAMVAIFKKIGSKENAREGLNDLYDFKKKHPDADLEPYLKKTSQYFQNYVERGLRIIDKERTGKSTSDSPVSHRSESAPAHLSSHSSSSTEEAPNQLLERLRILRANCGLDNVEKTETLVKSSEPQPVHREISIEPIAPQEPEQEEQEQQQPTTVPSQMSSKNFSEIKARLERIKKLAKS